MIESIKKAADQLQAYVGPEGQIQVSPATAVQPSTVEQIGRGVGAVGGIVPGAVVGGGQEGERRRSLIGQGVERAAAGNGVGTINNVTADGTNTDEESVMTKEKSSASKSLLRLLVKRSKYSSKAGKKQRKKKKQKSYPAEKKADLRSDLLESIYARPELMGAGLGAGVGGLGGGLYSYLSGQEDVALPALLGALLGGGAGGAAGYFGQDPIRQWAMRERLQPELSKALDALSNLPSIVKEEVVTPAVEKGEKTVREIRRAMESPATGWSKEISPEQKAYAKRQIAKGMEAGQKAHERDIGLVGRGIEGIGEAANAIMGPPERAVTSAGSAAAGAAGSVAEAPGRAADYYKRKLEDLNRYLFGFQHR